MKTIQVQLAEELSGKSIEEIAHYFEQLPVGRPIDSLNWPDRFSLKPDCQFKIVRTKEKLYIRFDVKEKNIRAVYEKDQSPVYQDSCVEFFCKLPGEKMYYNFEFNCIGTCSAGKRESRTENLHPLNESQLSQIERFSSLKRIAFEEKSGLFEWNLTVGLPLKLIHAENAAKLSANFYKCGDKTREPHYLSWNPVLTEKPDFHRPEFFGELEIM